VHREEIYHRLQDNTGAQQQRHRGTTSASIHR
jgi:sRNA-binding carbon storage regulator CsrA